MIKKSKRTITPKSGIKNTIINRNNEISDIRGLTIVPSGSTTLNLACSDNQNGAFVLGTMINIIGDSSSGKTLLCLTTLAELCKLPYFNKYKFIHDNVERTEGFDIEYLFGKGLKKRIQSPSKDKHGKPIYSSTIQDFQLYINKWIKSKEPFIYILDSLDALDAEEDIKKREEIFKAKEKGNKTSGSYKMAKPKALTEILRDIVDALSNSQSLLIIISQTRDNIDPMSFEKKTRSGGRALKFFASHEIWMALAGKIMRTVKGKKYVIGNNVTFKVSKNKLTGKIREGGFPIYYDYGLDDIQSCVDYLIDNKVWSKTDNTINAAEINYKGGYDKLIQKIENDKLEGKLKQIVGNTWREIEDKLKLSNRKRKYE